MKKSPNRRIKSKKLMKAKSAVKKPVPKIVETMAPAKDGAGAAAQRGAARKMAVPRSWPPPGMMQK